jgi:hypothetical protein
LDEIIRPNEHTFVKAQKVNYEPLDMEYHDLFSPITYSKIELYPVKFAS